MMVVDLAVRKFCDELRTHLKKEGFQHFKNARREDGYIRIDVLTDEGWATVQAKPDELLTVQASGVESRSQRTEH